MTAVGSGSAPKAPATTALSHTSQFIGEISQGARTDVPRPASESISNNSSSLLGKKGTSSTSTARNSSRRASGRVSGTGTQHSRSPTEEDGQQGSVSGNGSLKKKIKRSSGDANLSGNISNIRQGASDILKRYDDILPHERGGR